MVVLGGWVFLISEVPLYVGEASPVSTLQGYLAHKNVPPPATPQWGYAYGPLVVGVFLSARCPCRRLEDKQGANSRSASELIRSLP